jgi:hypothetical protein
MTSQRECIAGAAPARFAAGAVAVLATLLCGLSACKKDVVVDAAPAQPAVVVPVVLRSFEEQIEASGQLIAKTRAMRSVRGTSSSRSIPSDAISISMPRGPASARPKLRWPSRRGR